MGNSMMQAIREGREAERKLHQELKQKFSLTYPQFETLKATADHAGTISIGEIAETIGCSRSNLTNVCDQLERDGWIERERSKADRRIVHIRLVRDFAPVAAWANA